MVGSQTATVIFSGSVTGTGKVNTTEEYNGSTWSNVPGTMAVARYGTGYANNGTQTAALGFGGYLQPGFTSSSESYDGTTWTATSPLISIVGNQGGAGTQTAAISFAGLPGDKTQTESWDGSSWTVVNSMNSGRQTVGGFGLQTAATGAGGTGPGTDVESWNGTTWSTDTSLATGRRVGGAFGSTAPIGAVAGGGTSPFYNSTEEFTGATLTVKTITTS